jgi:hypothetical protein
MEVEESFRAEVGSQKVELAVDAASGDGSGFCNICDVYPPWRQADRKSQEEHLGPGWLSVLNPNELKLRDAGSSLDATIRRAGAPCERDPAGRRPRASHVGRRRSTSGSRATLSFS